MSTINEIFPFATVKQVIFQIRYPNLFFLENRIGNFQIKVMREFPESALIFRRQILFADVGPDTKIDDIPTPNNKSGQKIWQFKSNKDYQLDVTSDSLSIVSQFHKTYNLGESDKFRDVIQFILGVFFEISEIPLITRIGLRYIDECPIPIKNNETFEAWYNSTFPINRFNLAYTEEMDFKTITKRGDYYLRYIESLKKMDDKYKLILDFDGFANNIEAGSCLSVTDSLHDIISEEYKKTIKEPLTKYMRDGVIE